MQLFATRGLVLATATGSLVLSGFGVAFAEANAGSASSSPRSVLSGSNVNASANAPVTVCGNGVAVLGVALAGDCVSTGSTGSASSDSRSSNRGSVGSGNNVNLAVNAPVTVCGNAVGGGIAKGGDCPASSGSGAGGATAGGSSRNDRSAGSGNNVNSSVNAPVTVCGNALAVLGAAEAGDCGSAGGPGASSGSTSHNPGSVGSGNNVTPVVNAPVTVCGNGSAVGGVAVPGDCPAQGGGSDPQPTEPGDSGSKEPPNGQTGTPKEPGGGKDDDQGEDGKKSVQGGPLAHTGASGLWLAALGAAFVAGGVAFHRRFRPRSID